MVITHVTIIRCAVSHFTPRTLCDVPTPKIEEEITCVVLTGKCKKVAPKMTAAPVAYAATPFTGRIFIIFTPTVLIIFYSPTAVHKVFAYAYENFIII